MNETPTPNAGGDITGVGNSWRTTGDIVDRWDKVMEILSINGRRWRYAGPGHFNDPDMLEVSTSSGSGGSILVPLPLLLLLITSSITTTCHS